MYQTASITSVRGTFPAPRGGLQARTLRSMTNMLKIRRVGTSTRTHAVIRSCTRTRTGRTFAELQPLASSATLLRLRESGRRLMLTG